ncbi:undecaprenyl-diphosphatase [Poseidonocella pacifica]|uniref:Undecaprenyl-diphosphatase n=1 Tax=Poseidonocella pacifica TaxID=871651 RepID=A0A1I0XNL9_9RHOB|nr:phosphatase PAP2 family protein [Poseidonocella pacifica]SFB02036.1 undecaprenyl-diphosphatase [Poseidonocella pacifica]
MDQELLFWLNSILGASDKFDYAYFLISRNTLTKSLPLIALFWLFWFLGREQGYPYRARVLASGLVGIIAIALGRVLAVTLPFRLRPIHDPEVSSLLEGPVPRGSLDGWSSLPSDHAVMFAALCLCIFMMHRGVGIVIGIYCFLVVLMPRIVYGLHWPSDILAGILFGMGAAALLLLPIARLLERSGALEFLERREPILYPLMFLLSFQMATMFDTARQLLELAARAVSYALGVSA